ncbi:MAG: imidazole glycerol phosphate synthase subunit HisH [Saprospiraceae bacterium]|nr:imidazole glycerol phosphate synthase subunit HisH [Saprospiraceae bacterium]
MITIIDYKVGNLGSIRNMLKYIGVESMISASPDDVASAEKLILPGVGHFDYGMRKLHESGLVPMLNQRVLIDKVPILGICLGAQLFTEKSDEGVHPGLGWIKGSTIAFDTSLMDQKLKVPHMGWGEIIHQNKSLLWNEMYEEPRFYFVHSYHLQLANPTECLCSVNYGYEFCAGIEKENIIGVQFHPEKSHKYGMKVLENFAKIY